MTDLALSGEDGAMFLKWLRPQPSEGGGTVPAVAVTARYENYPPTEVSGCVAYFRKPVGITQFVQTVAAILNVSTERTSGGA